MPPVERAVTVIIPSRGLRERGALLHRAIDSVRAQRGVEAVPLVVLNGARRAREVEASVRVTPGVCLLVRAEADLPAALRAGREAVGTPWFATLDEDDELLPDALACRMEALQAQADADVVVTNAIRRHGDSDTIVMGDHIDVARDPLRAFLRRNWLVPGSWLARSDRVRASLFDGMPRYRECTFLALRFAIEYRMHWLQKPTVVYHVATLHAETRSREYLHGQAEALQQLLLLPLPGFMRREVRWAISAAFHEAADALWKAGEAEEAWRMHVRSLRAWGGLRFLPFSRHLLGTALRRMAASGGLAAE